jgi:hypothetical protein
MRIRTGLLVALALALSLAGCGGSADDGIASVTGATPTTSASPSAEYTKADGVRYARCMRANGIPNFPDPDVNGEGEVRSVLPEGVDKTKVKEAQQKCKQYLPNGGAPPKTDPKRLAQLRKFAKCMREHGVPNFPDPDASGGGLMVDGDRPGLDPESPTFQAAEKACAQYAPGRQTNKLSSERSKS